MSDSLYKIDLSFLLKYNMKERSSRSINFITNVSIICNRMQLKTLKFQIKNSTKYQRKL